MGLLSKIRRRILAKHSASRRSPNVVVPDGGFLSGISDMDARDLMSIFECSFCEEYISPPILQCCAGHLLCQPCFKKLPQGRKCPTCREMIPGDGIRNIAMEKVALFAHIRFPCKHKTVGCPDTYKLTVKAEHEKRCPYRPLKCSNVWSRCKWIGSTDAFIGHIKQDHCVRDVLDVPVVHQYMLPHLATGHHRWTSVLKYKGKEFLFMMAEDKGWLSALVVLVGEQVAANEFGYRLELKSHSGVERLIFEGKPKSVRCDVQSLFFGSEGLYFNRHTVRHFAEDRHLMSIAIDIYDI